MQYSKLNIRIPGFLGDFPFFTHSVYLNKTLTDEKVQKKNNITKWNELPVGPLQVFTKVPGHRIKTMIWSL